MPRRLRLFISSPGDVPKERLRADMIVEKLTQDFARFFVLESYRWEHEPMLASGHFQDAIDPPGRFDIVVLIVWSRLGTPLPEKTCVREYRGIDGRAPVTGTEWEYEDALRAQQANGTPDILVFRNRAPAEIDTFDAVARAKRLAQLDALDTFWKRHFADGETIRSASTSYRGLDEFAEKLERSLRKLVEQRVEDAAESLPPGGLIWTEAPFRGLRSYEFEHAPIFFGRDAAVARAAATLAARAAAGAAFLLVLGPSGAGKSSLVKAALVPRLMKPQRIAGTAFMRRVVFRPAQASGDPVAALVDALTHDGRAADIGLPELLSGTQTPGDLTAHLRRVADDPKFLFDAALGRVTENGRSSGRLLAYEAAKLILVVDQLEELFTVATIDAEDRRVFLRLLRGLAACGHVWVVATMRLDFWPRAGTLAELMALAPLEARAEIGAPSAAELAEMIRKPALAAGVSFQVDDRTGLGLDAVLAERAAGGAGVLPLLSFTLDALFTTDVVERKGRFLTYATYDPLGGLEGSIARRAEAIVAKSPAAARKALPGVLRDLVTLSSDAVPALVAQVVPMAAFPVGSGRRAMVEALLEGRLLVASSAGATPIVRLVHEALIGHWQRAHDQLVRERRDIETRTLVERQAVRWSGAAKADKRKMVLRDPDLAAALDLAQRWSDDMQAPLRAFVVVSAKAAKAASRRRWVIAAAVMTALALLAAASIAALAIAEGQRDDALVAASRGLARDARAATARGEPTLAMILSLAALPRTLAHPDRPFVRDAEYPLADAFANRRERAVLAGHAGDIDMVAFSPDGSRLVTASEDHTARIWDLRTRASLALSSGHISRVVSAGFSPDGGRIVTASADGTAALWDAATGTYLHELRHEHFLVVHAAVFSPDGGRVATASDDGTARVWDGRTGARIAIMRGHVGPVLSVAFSPDAKRLVTASADGTARLWDAATGADGPVLRGHGSAVKSTALSHDGTRIVTASEDGTARVWDAATGALKLELDKHAAPVVAASFSPDGKLVVTASADRTARIWDAVTGDPRFILGGHAGPVDAATFSPDGKRVATASDDKTVRLWAVATGRSITVIGGFEGPVTAAVFSRDGTLLATAARQTVARVFGSEPDAAVATLAGHSGEVSRAVYARDGSRLATASSDGTARIWDARTSAPLALLTGHRGAVDWVAFSPDGTRVATASADRTARIWDGRTGAWSATLQGHRAPVNTIALSPDGRLAVTASDDGTAIVWDAGTGAEIGALVGHRSRVKTAAFSSDGALIVTASSDLTAKIWDAHSRRLLKDLKGHDNVVHSAAFSHDGTRIVTASGDKTARVWDTASGAPIATLSGHGSDVTAALFSPDDTMVLTASWDHTARLWDARSGRLAATLEGHDNTVWSAVFSPDGRRVVTASEDHTSRLWDVATAATMAVFREHADRVWSAAFSPDGGGIATASADGNARLWRVPPLCQPLIEAARAALPRQLTETERARYVVQQRTPRVLVRLHAIVDLILPRRGESCDGPLRAPP